MKEYYLHSMVFGNRELGRVNVQIDTSKSGMEGHWRQKKPFNSKFDAAGVWTYNPGHNPLLLLFDNTNSMFSKPLVVLERCFLRQGVRGGGYAKFGSLKDEKVGWMVTGSQKLQEITIQDIARKTKYANWKIKGGKGFSYSVGEVVTVEGSTGSITLTGSSKTGSKNHELIYSTAGVGIGTSWVPVSVSGSVEEMPSGGIGSIYSTKDSQIALSDFEGLCGICEVSGSAKGMGGMNPQTQGGALYALVFWAKESEAFFSPFSIGFMWGSALGIAASTAPGYVSGALSVGTVVVMR